MIQRWTDNDLENRRIRKVVGALYLWTEFECGTESHLLKHLSRVRVEDADLLVLAGGDEPGTVVVEGHGPDLEKERSLLSSDTDGATML